MTQSEPQIPILTVVTTETADATSLIPLLEEDAPLLWMRRGFGVAGIGAALRLEFTGPTRLADAAQAWRRVTQSARVTDPLALPGTGLIALGAFTFSDRSDLSSVLIVPSTIVGRSARHSWITRIAVGAQPPAPIPEERPLGDGYRVSFSPGTLGAETYRDAVAHAVSEIRGHRLSKVVLARDLVGRLPDGADLRVAVGHLALGYPDCWTFAVDGFVGSSPETLVGVHDGTVTARVLAGSSARGTDAGSDQDSATALATSAKDLDEHRYAVQSVLASLRPHSPTVLASDQPFTLRLPNLWHLASDVEGDVTDGSSALDLVAALHPTAAVAGTPTSAALTLIESLEPFDRGRYAGPVGWVGANGDGEWAVAVRSAQVLPDGTVTAYAGAGIVAESIPERELVETRLKFKPVVEAFD